MMNRYLEKLTTLFFKNVLNITFKNINPSTSLEKSIIIIIIKINTSKYNFEMNTHLIVAML
jgi:hypothetical protein